MGNQVKWILITKRVVGSSHKKPYDTFREQKVRGSECRFVSRCCSLSSLTQCQRLQSLVQLLHQWTLFCHLAPHALLPLSRLTCHSVKYRPHPFGPKNSSPGNNVTCSSKTATHSTSKNRNRHMFGPRVEMSESHMRVPVSPASRSQLQLPAEADPGRQQ